MKTWVVVITVYGQVVFQSEKPMTAEDCALQVAYRVLQIEQSLSSDRPIPEEYGGENVTRENVEVKCRKV